MYAHNGGLNWSPGGTHHFEDVPDLDPGLHLNEKLDPDPNKSKKPDSETALKKVYFFLYLV